MGSAVVLMCCAHSLRLRYDVNVADEVCVALLRMMVLSPDGNSYAFLKSLMKEKSSLYVLVHS